ncbi:MAG: prepilin-type N-terminal cleavage/methylation domain-containing protein [Planctomycetes bacterium]|nr:prepilin-type N-terminal cleavage/methylation domain-containing protein [Planctomycetota bacterium]
MRKTSKGFTLIELLVVVAIIALLISILLPSLARARELAKRLVCAANMKGIATSMKIYANENEENWPTPSFDEGVLGVDPAIVYTGIPPMPGGDCAEIDDPCQGTPNRLTESQSALGDKPTVELSVTRAYWLLVRSGETTAKQFICPSSGDNADLTEQIDLFYDFFSAANISYGYQVPFGPRETRASENIDPRMPLGADHGPYSVSSGMPPDDFDQQTAPRLWQPYNSPNHGGTSAGEGQNVLYADGHASFERKPLVGIDGDNIYSLMDRDASFVGRFIGSHPEGTSGGPSDPFPGQLTFGDRHANTDSLIWP